MSITKDQILSMIRAMLVLLGSFILGKNIGNAQITETIVQEIIGAGLIVTTFVWSALTKCLTIEIFQSSILKVVMVVGTIAIASGKIADKTFQALLAVVTAILPILYSFLSKEKSKKIIDGDIQSHELTK